MIFPRMTTSLAIRSLSSGGLITNYFCSSRCRHCLYGCGPEWRKDYITPAQTERNLTKLKSLGCRSVHIGGGEPVLRPEALLLVLETAARLGVGIEYLETNSSWYHDHDSAVALLRRLAGAGLETVMVSISPYHNEFIPFEKVRGVMEATRVAGLGLFAWIQDFMPDVTAFPESVPHPLAEYEARFGAGYIKSLVSRYGLTLRGRPLKTYAATLERRPLASLLASETGSCRELGTTQHFHIDVYGGYLPGLCSGLSIAVDDLGTALDPERYPLLCRLYGSGIRALLEHAQSAHGFAPAAAYHSKCDLCQDIRGWLTRQAPGRYRELAPAEFYQYL